MARPRWLSQGTGGKGMCAFRRRCAHAPNCLPAVRHPGTASPSGRWLLRCGPETRRDSLAFAASASAPWQHRAESRLRQPCSAGIESAAARLGARGWQRAGGVVHKYSAARTNSRKPSHNPGPVHAPLSGGFDFYQASTDAAPRQARSRGPPARLSFRGLHSHGSSTSTGWHPAALCRPRRRHPGMVRREALARADFRAKHGRLRHAPCTAWGARAWTPS